MGEVYFIQQGDGGAIKIGYSTEPERRRVSLQTACPEPLRLIGRVRGSPALERSLHYRFRNLRLVGEWFRCDPSLLTFIVDLERGDVEVDPVLTSPPRTQYAALFHAEYILQNHEGVRGTLRWNPIGSQVEIRHGALLAFCRLPGQPTPPIISTSSVTTHIQDYLGHVHDVYVKSYGKLLKLVVRIAKVNPIADGERP